MWEKQIAKQSNSDDLEMWQVGTLPLFEQIAAFKFLQGIYLHIERTNVLRGCEDSRDTMSRDLMWGFIDWVYSRRSYPPKHPVYFSIKEILILIYFDCDLEAAMKRWFFELSADFGIATLKQADAGGSHPGYKEDHWNVGSTRS